MTFFMPFKKAHKSMRLFPSIYGICCFFYVAKYNILTDLKKKTIFYPLFFLKKNRKKYISKCFCIWGYTKRNKKMIPFIFMFFFYSLCGFLLLFFNKNRNNCICLKRKIKLKEASKKPKSYWHRTRGGAAFVPVTI
jgi:hypothetical protein